MTVFILHRLACADVCALSAALEVVFRLLQVIAGTKPDTFLLKLVVEIPLHLDLTVSSPPQSVTPGLALCEVQLGTLGLTLRLRQEGVHVGPAAAVVVRLAEVVPVREEPPLLTQLATAVFRRLEAVLGVEWFRMVLVLLAG